MTVLAYIAVVLVLVPLCLIYSIAKHGEELFARQPDESDEAYADRLHAEFSVFW